MTTKLNLFAVASLTFAAATSTAQINQTTTPSKTNLVQTKSASDDVNEKSSLVHIEILLRMQYVSEFLIYVGTNMEKHSSYTTGSLKVKQYLTELNKTKYYITTSNINHESEVISASYKGEPGKHTKALIETMTLQKKLVDQILKSDGRIAPQVRISLESKLQKDLEKLTGMTQYTSQKNIDNIKKNIGLISENELIVNDNAAIIQIEELLKMQQISLFLMDAVKQKMSADKLKAYLTDPKIVKFFGENIPNEVKSKNPLLIKNYSTNSDMKKKQGALIESILKNNGNIEQNIASDLETSYNSFNNQINLLTPSLLTKSLDAVKKNFKF